MCGGAGNRFSLVCIVSFTCLKIVFQPLPYLNYLLVPSNSGIMPYIAVVAVALSSLPI